MAGSSMTEKAKLNESPVRRIETYQEQREDEVGDKPMTDPKAARTSAGSAEKEGSAMTTTGAEA